MAGRMEGGHAVHLSPAAEAGHWCQSRANHMAKIRREVSQRKSDKLLLRGGGINVELQTTGTAQAWSLISGGICRITR